MSSIISLGIIIVIIASLTIISEVLNYGAKIVRDWGRTYIVDEFDAVSPQFRMREDIAKWCEDNISGKYGVEPDLPRRIWFARANDAILFKLMWGSRND